jgi:hypothetical protein
MLKGGVNLLINWGFVLPACGASVLVGFPVGLLTDFNEREFVVDAHNDANEGLLIVTCLQ